MARAPHVRKRTTKKANEPASDANPIAPVKPVHTALDDPALVVPQVTVRCVNARCSQYDVEHIVPAGVLVATGVIAAYRLLTCSVCGMDLFNT